MQLHFVIIPKKLNMNWVTNKIFLIVTQDIFTSYHIKFLSIFTICEKQNLNSLSMSDVQQNFSVRAQKQNRLMTIVGPKLSRNLGPYNKLNLTTFDNFFNSIFFIPRIELLLTKTCKNAKSPFGVCCIFLLLKICQNWSKKCPKGKIFPPKWVK